MTMEGALTPKMPLHIPRTAAAAAPIPAGYRSAELLRHGTLELRWFAPPAIGLDHDPQKPHERDEVYIVASGTGRFVRGEESLVFGPTSRPGWCSTALRAVSGPDGGLRAGWAKVILRSPRARYRAVQPRSSS
jgi:hypothetical protein